MRPAFPVVTLLLLVALSLLGPLSQASPPDPIWIGGLFDGGDTDDVVVAATSAEGATEGMAPLTGAAVLLAAGPVPLPVSIACPSAAAPVFQGRAPPFA